MSTSKNQKTFKYSIKDKDDSDEEYMPSYESDDNENNLQAAGFQRVWSEKDEISILEACLNYSSDCDVLLSFVKDKLEVETSKTQLQTKLKRLKNKYKKNIVKRSFSKPHEEKLFKLSKKIWGSQVKCKSISDDHFVLSGGSAADLEDWFRRNPGQLIKEKDRKEMLEKSECVKIGKARQYLLEIQVMEEQTNLAIDALESIDN
ncbi:probable transcription factor At1g61730 [Solanum pennellii]|uniref:Probable transcription factor At1g61730 n=1 Tax=Solanum pennellii TaxID=28526 RepID=A0ABM1V2H1_SOLPN|nr:probable transcription factor At1g61730 [Solanum pennellii]